MCLDRFSVEVELKAPSMFSRVLNLKSSHAVASCYSVLCDQSPFPYGIAIDLSSSKEAKYFFFEGIPLVFQCGKGHKDMVIHGNVRRVEEKRSVQ